MPTMSKPHNSCMSMRDKGDKTFSINPYCQHRGAPIGASRPVCTGRNCSSSNCRESRRNPPLTDSESSGGDIAASLELTRNSLEIQPVSLISRQCTLNRYRRILSKPHHLTAILRQVHNVASSTLQPKYMKRVKASEHTWAPP